MPLKYYPLNRIVTGLYTRGNEYITPDGKLYTGKYYTTFDNKAFTGTDPVLGTNLLLTPVNQEPNYHEGGRTPTLGAETYAALQNRGSDPNRQTDNNGRLTELISYFPTPLDSDYARGYFTRYFAKTVSGPGIIFEISKIDFTKIQNGDIDTENILGYESIDMLWQLTGPLKDTRISQYQIKGGVFDTNKRVTETKNKVFNGLLDFIGGDYTKFARITP